MKYYCLFEIMHDTARLYELSREEYEKYNHLHGMIFGCDDVELLQEFIEFLCNKEELPWLDPIHFENSVLMLVGQEL